jgi:hypothetical protein
MPPLDDSDRKELSLPIEDFVVIRWTLQV